jgi:Rrf2 family transcriptional regulator, cysteine metabolism repressor
MIFSTKSTYGLRAMIYLAKQHKQGSIPLAAIAEHENISLKYLERLFSKLKKGNLIISEIGSAGGYKLAKRPAQINILEIIRALEGKLKAFHCTEKNGKVYCNSQCNCEVNLVLNKVEEAINKTLIDIKLSQLL